MKRAIIVLLIAGFAPTFARAQKNPQVPQVQTPAVFRADPNSPATPQSLADSRWFEIFRDPRLQELIREALLHNYDLRESVARIDLARANLGLARSEQFPTIAASADVVTVGRSRDGELTIPEPLPKSRSFGSVLLNLLTFELDIWGRLRKQTKAARHDLLSTEEARKAVLTTIVSDVAGTYFVLRELDFELEIARRTLNLRRESLRIITLRQQRGVATMLEVRQAEELVYDATETIPDLERAIEQQENFLSVLVGRNPGPIVRGVALTEEQVPPSVPPGLPSDLLVRRPDIRAAEASLVAAGARIDVARKAYLPRISLSGFLGFESASLSDLFKSSRGVWGFIPQLTQPIFTGGRLKSNVRFTQAQRDLFLVDYERRIQNAFREVSNSLIAYRKVREVRAQRELLVTTLQDRARLSYMRYTGGVANLLEALDADRELFDAERSLAQARRDELLTVVQLYKALGGGWQP
ncbi:MAG TPA: efflux transporter outer membrane subunit [Pyrinomonadaceae bacterium]|nr:efflux transporter outer membrane subunit [Pyrinomonadaceae bacterium]